ncbi:hypothetical protein [Rubritalea tangerina]
MAVGGIWSEGSIEGIIQVRAYQAMGRRLHCFFCARLCCPKY